MSVSLRERGGRKRVGEKGERVGARERQRELPEAEFVNLTLTMATHIVQHVGSRWSSGGDAYTPVFVRYTGGHRRSDRRIQAAFKGKKTAQNILTPCSGQINRRHSCFKIHFITISQKKRNVYYTLTYYIQVRLKFVYKRYPTYFVQCSFTNALIDLLDRG